MLRRYAAGSAETALHIGAVYSTTARSVRLSFLSLSLSEQTAARNASSLRNDVLKSQRAHLPYVRRFDAIVKLDACLKLFLKRARRKCTSTAR